MKPLATSLLISALLSQTHFLQAKDLLTLSNGEELTGEIVTIKKDNTLEFKHAASDQLILIDSNKLQKTHFNIDPDNVAKRGTTLLELTNGDTIMAFLEEISEQNVKFSTPGIGSHVISRDRISRIVFGSLLEQNIFSIAANKRALSRTNSWAYRNEGISTTNRGDMWEKLPLTRDFKMKFNLEWTSSGRPNLLIHLCGNNQAKDASNPRYELFLKASSITLSQQTLSRKKILSSHRFPASKVGEMMVEIRVSRSSRRVIVLIDGKEVISKDLDDPKQPSGSFIGFQNQSARGHKINITELSIDTWDGLGGHSKKRPASDEYRIEPDNNNNYSGVLKSIKKDGAGKLMCYFENPLSTINPEVHALNKINFIEFPVAKLNFDQQKQTKLRSGSKLRLSDISLKNGELNASHPILGNIKIDKSNLSILNPN